MKAIMRDVREMKNSGIEWMENIPSNWNVAKIRNVIVQGKDGIKIGPFGSALTNKTSGDAEYKIYGQANLVSGDFSDTKNKISKETFIELQNYEVVPNDICISMMGTIGKCLTVPLGISKGIMDSHLIKIRLKATVDNRFFEYVYDKDKGGICYTQMQYEKKGSIMDGLNTTIVKGLYLPLPSLEEQTNIANYLDDRCSKIDAIIAEAKASIEEYKELKQAVIYEAVTKGLDKNVEMKDSGIEWIGKIPKSWEYVSLKRIYDYSDGAAVRVGPFGSALPSNKFTDEGIWVYTQRTVLDNNFTTNDTFINESLADELSSFAVKGNDILITTRGSVGKIAIVPTGSPKGILHPCLIRFRVDLKKYNIELLKFMFNESDFMMNQILRMSNSTIIDVLYSYNLKELKIPLIPLSEQNRIVQNLTKRCNMLDDIMREKQSLIDNLESYKKSLIYEVVTGKQKVVE